MSSRAGVLLVLAGTALLFAPALGVGLTLDDYWWLVAARASTPQVAPYELAFDEPAALAFWRAQGVWAWWAVPDFRWSLLRPAAVRLLEAEWSLFGVARPAGYQAVALVGYLSLVALAWPLYRRLLDARTALLALALFATHFAHLQTVWFVSNQHSLFGTLPALAAVLAWLRWREDGWRPGAVLAPLGVMSGLLFGETAVNALFYVGAYELFARTGPLPRRLARVAPPALLLAGYAALHGALGYGVRGHGLYVDPRVDPLAFLLAAGERVPVLLGALANLAPAELWLLQPRLRPGLVAVGLAAAMTVGALVRAAWPSLTDDERRAARWMAAGALASLTPGIAAPPGGRMVLWASLGGSLLLALALRHGWRAVRAGGRATLPALVPLAAANLLVMPLGGFLQLFAMQRLAAGLRDAADSPALATLAPDEEVVVLNMPDPFTALALLPARSVEHGRPPPAGWWMLSAAPHDHRVVRTGPDTLELTVIGGSMLEESFEQLFRPASAPLHPGDTLTNDAFEARVLEVGAAGPSRIAFTFAGGLERYRVLAWREGRLERVELPAPGGGLALPWSPSPLRPR